MRGVICKHIICVNIVAVQAYLCHIVQGFMLPYKGSAFQAAANDTIAYQLQWQQYTSFSSVIFLSCVEQDVGFLGRE